MSEFEDEMTLFLTAEEVTTLIDSVSWSLQATERTLTQRPDSSKAKARWETLDDIMQQLNDLKRAKFLGSNG